MEAEPNTYTIDGHEFRGMLYNGQYIPPMWRVRLADTLTVTLRNRLSEQSNLHFHGSGVSPLGNGGDVFLHIGRERASRIKSKSQRNALMSGFLHMHGDVDRKISGGMSGWHHR